MIIFNKLWEYLGFLTTALALFLAYWTVKLWWLENDKMLYIATIVASICFYVIPLFIIIFKFSNFRRDIDSLNKALILYFEFIFIFAGIYCWVYLLGGEKQITGFYPLDREMLESRSNLNLEKYTEQLKFIIIDSFHFSLVTASTLGYGDMTPNHPLSKIIVDIQIILTFIIIIFGINGRYSIISGENSSASIDRERP